MFLDFCCVGFCFVSTSQEIGWEERHRGPAVLCQVRRKAVVSQSRLSSATVCMVHGKPGVGLHVDTTAHFSSSPSVEC